MEGEHLLRAVFIRSERFGRVVLKHARFAVDVF